MTTKAKTAATFAERYETTLVPVIFQPQAKELIRRAKPKNGEAILDLACGTGAVTQELINAGVLPRIQTGVDISADMLAVARQKSKHAGYKAEFIEADAAHLPFLDGQFDLAFCQQALQFFPDRASALAELRRVLKPGGRVVMCVSTALSSNPLLQSQANTLDKYAGSEAGDAVRAICSLTDADEIQEMFESAGFENVTVELVSLSLTHPDGRAFAAGAMGGMHTGDKLSLMDAAERQRCFDEFLTGLGDCFDGTALHFPHVSNVISAQA